METNYFNRLVEPQPPIQGPVTSLQHSSANILGRGRKDIMKIFQAKTVLKSEMTGPERKFQVPVDWGRIESTPKKRPRDRCGSTGVLELQRRESSCLSWRRDERQNKVLQLMKAPKILLY